MTMRIHRAGGRHKARLGGAGMEWSHPGVTWNAMNQPRPLAFSASRMRSASTPPSGGRASLAPNTPASARSATQPDARPCRRLTRAPAPLPNGLGGLAHLLGPATAVLDRPPEEVAALLFPVDAGKRFGQRGEHLILDAVGARSRKALDDHGLEALDHDAPAHLGGRRDSELIRGNRGIEPKRHEQRLQRRRRRAAEKQRHADPVRARSRS